MTFKVMNARGHVLGGIAGRDQVGAGELVALRQQQAGQPAHATAADADEMDPLRSTLQQLFETLFQFRLHDASISSATRFAASTPASPLAAFAIALRTVA